jgi:flagellar motor switch protein FliN/FliY
MDAVETVETVDATPIADPIADVAPVAADSDEIQFEALTAPGPAASAAGADLGRVIDVPVELAVEIGRTTMTIGETLSLAPGSIVSLNRLAGEPVDLLVNGKVIAQGEVVVIDEEFGLRITDIVSASQRLSEATAPPVE